MLLWSAHAPLDLREPPRSHRDGGCDAGHQHQRREHGHAGGTQVVDDHRDRGECGGEDDAPDRRLAALHVRLKRFGNTPSLRGGPRHLRADHRPAVERADAGDDDDQGHDVAPGPAEDGGVGRSENGAFAFASGWSGRSRRSRSATGCTPRRWPPCPGWWTGGCSGLGCGPWPRRPRPSRAEIAEQGDGHAAADRADRASPLTFQGVKLADLMEKSPTTDMNASAANSIASASAPTVVSAIETSVIGP